MSYVAETLASAWAHVRLCADPTWTAEPPDDFAQANQRLWARHCFLVREEVTASLAVRAARATQSRQAQARPARKASSEPTQPTADTGHRAAGEGRSGSEKKNESTKRSVQDVIPNSRLARSYGTFFYDDAREECYAKTEPREADNATTSDSGCGSEVSPSEQSECWMSQEVDYWFRKLTDDVSSGDARSRNLRRFASWLGYNPGPIDDDFLDSAVETLSKAPPLTPKFKSPVEPTCPICHCPCPESQKQTCYSCPIGATQYTVSTVEEANLYARLHSDQVKAVWLKHTPLSVPAATATLLRTTTPADTRKIRTRHSRRAAKTTPTPLIQTKAPLDVRLPEFYPDKTEAGRRSPYVPLESVPPYRSIPVYQRPSELYQARGRGPPISSSVDRGNLIVLTDGQRGKSLGNLNLRSGQSSNSSEDRDVQQALSDWMRDSYPSRFLDLQYAGTLINELKLHAEVPNKKEGKHIATNRVPKTRLYNEVCKSNVLRSNPVVWPTTRPHPRTFHCKPAQFSSRNFLIQMPQTPMFQSRQNLSFPHHLYGHHAAVHHVPQMTVLSPLKALYATAPTTLVSSPYYQTLSCRAWQGNNALINTAIPIKPPMMVSHKANPPLQAANLLGHSHSHVPILSTFMLPVLSSVVDLANAPEKKRLYSAVLSNANESNPLEHEVNKNIDMSQLLRSGVENTDSKIDQKSSSQNVSLALSKEKCNEPVNCETRFEELEKEALEQYKPSDESIDTKFRELEQQALDQYSGTSNSNTSCSSAQLEAAKGADGTQCPK